MLGMQIPSNRRFLIAALVSAALAIPSLAQHLSGGRGSAGGHISGPVGVSHGSFAPRGNFGGFSPQAGFRGGFSAPHTFPSSPRFNWSPAARPYSSFHPVSRPNFSLARPNFSPMRSMRPGIASGSRMPYIPEHRTGPWHGGGRGDHYRDRDHDHDRRWRYDGWRQPYIPTYWANSTYLVGGSLPLSPYPGYWDDIDWNDDFDSSTGNYGNYAGTPYVNPGYSSQGGYAPAGQVDNSQPENNYAPDNYAYSAPPQSPSREPYRPETSEAAPVAERPAITLIFNDGRAPLQVHNYAITRSHIYVYDGQQRNIPLSQLDLPATEKTNQEAGNDFSLPEMP